MSKIEITRGAHTVTSSELSGKDLRIISDSIEHVVDAHSEKLGYNATLNTKDLMKIEEAWELQMWRDLSMAVNHVIITVN